MQRLMMLLLGLLWCSPGVGQVVEHFTDGGLGSDPQWLGDTAHFTVNVSGELQLDAGGAGVSAIHTANTLCDSTEWLIRLRLAFSPSSSNLARVWLMALTPLPGGYQDGYYLQFGESGSVDAITLVLDSAGTAHELCRGPSGQVAAPFDLEVRVTRSRSGEWKLMAREPGQLAYLTLAQATDTRITGTAWFGLQCIYTQSNSKNFIFDDLIIREIYRDLLPPTLDTAWAESREVVVIRASEALSGEALDPENYLIPFTGREPAQVSWQGTDHKAVSLFFPGGLDNGDHLLRIGTWCDADTNCSGGLNALFTLRYPLPWDIVIHELMFDPDPAPPALPATDYLELLNRSAYPQRLSGWKLWIGPTPVLLPTLEVPAGGLIVLTPKPQAFQGLSGCYALQALTLPNAGTTLRLTDAWGVLICRLDYRPEWIDDPFRAEGGWSLEQVDEGRPWDPENNWKVSHAAAGGTPCAPNSRAGIQPDDHAPRLLKVWPVGPSSLRLSFSEPMGAPVREPGRYALTPDSLKILGISDASGAGMELTLSTSPLPGEGIPCSLQTGDGLMDLSGNPLPSTTLCFGQPMESRAGDLVINELLFDPWPGGEDYVEIYHRSDHVLDLQWLRLCSRDPETGEVQQISRICRDTALLCPGEFRVLCPDQEAVAAQYPQACGEAFLDDMADFPSFSDGEGGVLLSRYDGLSIDAFDYDESLHSAFLSDPEGVALERIDPDLPAARADNWQSASLASGYASPGCPNAQPPAQETRESVEVAPPLLSPDGDGRDEVLTISLRPGRAGSLANLRIFTEGGRPCRTLALGALLGEEDHFYWKGENEGGQRVAPGRYLVLVQFFHEDGSTQALRELVWVAY